ncbi:MAG TPA: RsmE family RNA methyltransferase [Candidatus Kapabacteria bacterium]|nr:RsmE family RNA methyltransferase [Candidatus Kapabacteria bacterium]HPO64042.1 RsmE family RNA methyltransferase [Candidatus Kapabacteria bacterium]
MDCIYYPSFNNDNNYINIEHTFTNHLKALRVRLGDNLLITNGQGLLVKTVLMNEDKQSYVFKILEKLENIENFPNRFALALGILDSRDRFEFAFEKAVELGITDFFPLITKNTQKDSVKNERLAAKAIAAISQSQRAMLPIIHNPIQINELVEQFTHFSKVYIADITGKPLENNKNSESSIAIIGPEGGFTDDELDLLKSQENSTLFSLGNKRLRAETAAIVSLGLLCT